MWATNYIEKLQSGETVKFRPRGNSMSPKIESGELVTIEPITPETKLETGMIVLCKVKSKQYLHLISAIEGSRIQIKNNKGFINGWTNIEYVYGVCTKVEK